MANDDNAGRKPVGNDGDDPQDAALANRLDALGKRLDAISRTETIEAAKAASSGNASDLAQAFRLSTEFVAGVVAGAGIGWALDSVFATKPWGLIVFMMLGFGAGIMNVTRAAGLNKRKQP
jgi:ATP synthase protein I